MKKIVFWMLCVLLIMPVIAQARGKQEKPEAITIGSKHSMRSKILNEDRPYWISLPDSYDNRVYAPQKYPVIYLLDGDKLFHCLNGLYRELKDYSSIPIPECIIVGIPNTNRVRDLQITRAMMGLDPHYQKNQFKEAGEGKAFLRFVQEELIPEIDSKYRTMPYRILVGYSRGGSFALHTMLLKPDLFQAFIALDPVIYGDEDLFVSGAEALFGKGKERHESVYIALAGADGNLPARLDAVEEFANILKEAEKIGVRFKLEEFEKENHGSIVPLGLRGGLLHFFDGFRYSAPIEMNDILENPSLISERFKRISDQYGATFLPPEESVNSLGYYALRGLKDIDKAIQCFSINAAYYPESSNAFDSLGEAWLLKGEYQLSLESYRRSLDLNPNNQAAKKWIECLVAKNDDQIMEHRIMNLRPTFATDETPPSVRIDRLSPQGYIGYIGGNYAVYNDGKHPEENSIYRNDFIVCAGKNVYQAGRTISGASIKSGKIEFNDASLRNQGMVYSETPWLTSDLDVEISKLKTGEPKLVFRWTFTNSSRKENEVRLLWFVDGDIFSENGKFSENTIGFIPSPLDEESKALAMGATRDGELWPLRSLTLLTIPSAEKMFGISSPDGAIHYWSSQRSYSKTGIERSGYKIRKGWVNTIENDQDKDGWADELNDVGGVIENNITIPAGMNKTVEHVIIWGM